MLRTTLLAMVGAGLVTTPSPCRIVEWKIEDDGNGHSYEVVVTEQGVGWHEADELSRAMGGYLATITSESEDEFVFSLFKDQQAVFRDGFGPWIGLFQGENATSLDSGWNWVTGEEVTYTNWGPLDNPSEHFGHYFTSQPRQWNNAFDEYRFNYVVEYGTVSRRQGDFNMDGVVDSEDMDSLGREIAAGTDSASFDLNGDQLVDRTDRDIFLGGGLITSGNKLNGDADFDGTVDFSDFVVLSDYFSLKNRKWTQGDFDVNGDIEFPDFTILAGNFGKHAVASAASVPEPSGLALAALGLLGFIRRTKRHIRRK